MRYLTLIFLASLCFTWTSCSNSSKKNKDQVETADTSAVIFPDDTRDLTEVITRFVRAYSSQDNQKANALIHPDLGLYIIYRPGAADTYTHVDSLDFNKPIPEFYPYVKFSNAYTPQFDALPVFDCGSNRWDKLGFYCDTTQQASQLTKIAAFEHDFGQKSEAEVAEIEALEQDTYRVILTQEDNLIFHVKKYQDKWYIFVLDRAYGGCDA